MANRTPDATEPSAQRERSLVTLASIEAAAAALPMEVANSPVVSFSSGRYLKLESLQPTGSFKIRGALTRIRRIPTGQRGRGVVTYSSGNHGLAVARAARSQGVAATVVVPSDAPSSKVAAISAEGATLRVCDPGSETRRKIAEAISAATGQVLVPPYEDADVMAGQGTIGLELLAQIPHLTTVFVPVGGGGLVSGISAAIKQANPAIRVLGVEPELAADAGESFAAGRRIEWPATKVGRTISDALRTQAVGRLAFEHLTTFVDEMVTASDDATLDAAAQLMRWHHLVVEPAGALALAAMTAYPSARTDVCAAVISGGNASAEFVTTLVEHIQQTELHALEQAQISGEKPTTWKADQS